MTTNIAITNGRFGTANGWLDIWLHRLRSRRRKRIEILEFEAMSDHLLRDIGLTRNGIIRHAMRRDRQF